MHPITNYIKERIIELKRDTFEISLSVGNRPRISELQAVLSKLEELEKQGDKKIEIYDFIT